MVIPIGTGVDARDFTADYLAGDEAVGVRAVDIIAADVAAGAGGLVCE